MDKIKLLKLKKRAKSNFYCSSHFPWAGDILLFELWFANTYLWTSIREYDKNFYKKKKEIKGSMLDWSNYEKIAQSRGGSQKPRWEPTSEMFVRFVYENYLLAIRHILRSHSIKWKLKPCLLRKFAVLYPWLLKKDIPKTLNSLLQIIND